MTAKSKDTQRASRKPRSNLKKSDAHVVKPLEYDDIPELSDKFFERAELGFGAPARPTRGRPRKPDAKVHQGLRLSPDVLQAFKATGPKWQGRIDDALREHLKRHKLLPAARKTHTR